MNTVLAPNAPWPYPRTPRAITRPSKQIESAIVDYIQAHPGCSIHDIAPAVDLKPMTVNRKLRPIREAGYVVGQFVGPKNQGLRYWISN